MLHPKHHLTVTYYIVLLLAVLAAMVGYYVVYDLDFVLDKSSAAAVTIYTVVLCYVIVSVPLSFYFFSWKLKKIKEFQDVDDKNAAYTRLAVIRLVVISLGLTSSIFCYYITQQMSLFWLAGIEAIAAIICKPTERKICADLDSDDSDV